MRDALLHEEVYADIQHWLSTDMKWHVKGIIESPITGAEGNKEFLICAQKNNEKTA